MDAIGAKEARYGSGARASGSSGATALASLCGDQATNFTKLPSQRIQEIVKPTGPQESAFEDLKQASARAADELRASCPRQLAESLVARLDEMTAQLDAMVRAVKSLRPTLATFYASLDDEQKRPRTLGWCSRRMKSQNNSFISGRIPTNYFTAWWPGVKPGWLIQLQGFAD